jgi:hypothetical protein
LVTLVLFILLLRMSFAQLRFARNAFERAQGPRSPWALLAWGSSVSLAVHCVSFISVSYFGQMLQLFLFFVATVPALARSRRVSRTHHSSKKPSSDVHSPPPLRPRPANETAVSSH